MQNEEAIKSFDKAIEIDPNDYESLSFRGFCKYALKEYKEAIKDFDKVIELEPFDFENFRCIGYCKYYLDQYYRSN